MPDPSPAAPDRGRPALDVVDSTWLAAPRETVGAIVADPANWRRWWPGLELRVAELRQDKGVRWLVDSVSEGRDLGLAGSAEIWLEPMSEGTVAHFFLRLDPAPGRELPPRRGEQIVDGYRRRTKRAFWALGDKLDPGRLERHATTTRPDGQPTAPR